MRLAINVFFIYLWYCQHLLNRVTGAAAHAVVENNTLKEIERRSFTISINAMKALRAGLRKEKEKRKNVVRYHQVILRARFDQNKCVSDPKDQRRLYWVGENELFETKHPTPSAKFPRSIGLAGGVAAQRVVEPPDWVLDYWHPLEKAQYPEYFKTREIRKAEYICKWYKGEMM